MIRKLIASEVTEELETVTDSEIENEVEEEVTLTPEEDKVIRKLDYKIEKFTLTSDNVNDFVILANRRKISNEQVKKLHGVLLDGGNPINILIVNRLDGKNRLIDGNHRIEAAKRYFDYRKVYALTKIDCSLKVYENLTPEQERALYLDEAKRRNEGLDDRLNMFKDTIQLWKLLNDSLNPFPCETTIYPTENGLKLKSVLNAMSSTRRGTNTFGTVILDKNNIVGFAKDIKYEEFLVFKEFIKMFISSFGIIEKSNVFCKTHFFTPLYDIYALNQQYKNDNNFIERFEKIKSRSDILNFERMSNRSGMTELRKVMLIHMNKGCKTRSFI